MGRFLPFILLIASAGLFFAYVNPTYRGLDVQKAEVARLDEALNKAKELQAIRDKLLAKYNTFSSEDLERLRKLLPDHIDNVRLIIDMDNIASRYGMTITKVGIKRSEETDNDAASSVVSGEAASLQRDFTAPERQGTSLESPLGTVDLSFTVSGTYETFLAFLRDIERSLRLVDIVDLSFTSSKGNFYDFNITIRAYWLR